MGRIALTLTLTAILLLHGFVPLSAQTKVLERSAKKPPAWLNTAVDGNLVVSVEAASLGEAQQKALTSVTEQIIQSVASHVSVTQTNVFSEVNRNGDIDSRDAYDRLSKIRSANLPFLQGISLAKVTGVYWEKVRDKQTEREYYNYAILYPFPVAEQRRLQAAFEALDAEKVAQYKALERRITELDAVEEIKQVLAELEGLSAYFFDEVRISEVKALAERYRRLYDALSLTGTFTDGGSYRLQLLLNGNPIRTAATPRVTSNCASSLEIRPDDGAFLIAFRTDDCLPEEENTLTMRLSIEGRRLERKVSLNQAAGAAQAPTFSVVPEGRVMITTDSVADRTLYNLHIRLTLNNRGGLPFGLKAMELHVPGLTVPVLFDDINAVYKSKGIIQVRATAEGKFAAHALKPSDHPMVQGAVTVVNPQTGAVERIRLSLTYEKNW
ncbi:MAG: plethodontid receptivity factor PRF [Prevotellaceae bacterium]|jgi:hypothetical protein|nr:plethodontid receptivity factor PRF [Prevotellaceae bacterium]